MDRKEPYWGGAQQCSSACGVNAELMYAQWAHETGNFSEEWAITYNNWGGLKKFRDYSDPGAGPYQSFESGDDFVSYFATYIVRYDNMTSAQTTTDYATNLKQGGYFEDAIDNYVNGMNSFMEGGSGGSKSSKSGAAAASRKSIDPIGILKFAQFAQSLAFTKQMTEGFEQGMEYTLHSYLATFMSKFYHNMYYIPTLPDNKVMVVKPETMFIDPPSCNVIYPSMKFSLGFTRNAKQEPTRVLMISDPVTNIFGMSGGTLTQLVTMAFIDEDSNGQKVVGLGTMTDKKYPMRNMSAYEKKNGVRILRTNQGEDLYLFLVSNNEKKASTVDGKKTSATLLTSNVDPAGIGSTLSSLASYALLRNRYETRQGNAQMYFNPYIVPGFPFVSVEGTDSSSMNVFGYVTDVTHQITDRSWSTYVGFTGTHIAREPRPPVFPIIEQEYTSNIDATYKHMLGNAVSRVDGAAGAQACRTAYKNSDQTVGAMLKKVWRPLTTRVQHLETVCDGATMVTENGYTWFKNAEGSTFFDTAAQALLKGYTSNIMQGTAFSEADVR